MPQDTEEEKHDKHKLHRGLAIGLSAGIPGAPLMGWLAKVAIQQLYHWLMGKNGIPFPWWDVLSKCLPLIALWQGINLYNRFRNKTEREKIAEATRFVQERLEGQPMEEIGYLQELLGLEEPDVNMEEMLRRLLDRVEWGEPPVPPHAPIDWSSLVDTIPTEPWPAPAPGAPYPAPAPVPGPVPEPLPPGGLVMDPTMLFSSYLPTLAELEGSLLAAGLAPVAVGAVMPGMMQAAVAAGGAAAGMGGGSAVGAVGGAAGPAAAAAAAYLTPLVGAAAPSVIAAAATSAVIAAQQVSFRFPPLSSPLFTLSRPLNTY